MTEPRSSPPGWTGRAEAGSTTSPWADRPSAAVPDGIPPGFAQVDPRTARRVPLWQELGTGNPIFPGDPPFTVEEFTTVVRDGIRVERITSLGTHTGTHISAPAHVVEDGAGLSGLDERWALMPLVVLDVRDRVEASGGGFVLGPADLWRFEAENGPVPPGACVLLHTGFSTRFAPTPDPVGGAAPSRAGPGPSSAPVPSYSDPAPGFTADAVAWLFSERGIAALGSDTFGPDATGDPTYPATVTALGLGGITVENVGPGLALMRPYGDWIGINGPRPAFSGFPVGITGFTLP